MFLLLIQLAAMQLAPATPPPAQAAVPALPDGTAPPPSPHGKGSCMGR